MIADLARGSPANRSWRMSVAHSRRLASVRPPELGGWFVWLVHRGSSPGQDQENASPGTMPGRWTPKVAGDAAVTICGTGAPPGDTRTPRMLAAMTRLGKAPRPGSFIRKYGDSRQNTVGPELWISMVDIIHISLLKHCERAGTFWALWRKLRELEVMGTQGQGFRWMPRALGGRG